jgi:C2 domain
MTDWAMLETELLKYGISQDVLDEEFFFINEFLKRDHLVNRLEEEEELPGYTPGPKRGTIEEKVSLLEQTSRLMTMMEPEESLATSSHAAPPYTFEEGIEEDLDDDITECIRKAKEIEASQRFLAKEETPALVPHPYDWLPKAMIPEYKDSDEIMQMMDAASFSTMAYETAPRCAGEVDRLRGVLRVSFNHKKVGSSETFIEKALDSLDVVSTALYKFMLVRDQQNSAAQFSDLDALDFEFSTVAAVETRLVFPQREFDLAQKSYYSLLTYIMGFLEVLSSLMPGRTYVALPREELERMWNDRRMDTRIAWMEKRLASWNQVEEAVLFCREWYSLYPGLRLQASAYMKDWERSKRILSGSEGDDIIDLTIISASGLPKSNFMLPSAFAKLVFYGPNGFGAAMRLFSLKTDPVPKTQYPVWNKSFLIKVPPKSKMIDIEICDKVAGIDHELVRARLRFTWIPGLEASFENRSLMYGIDG